MNKSKPAKKAKIPLIIETPCGKPQSAAGGANKHKTPLLTLDRKLKKAAQNLNIETMEV
ncbi:MAG: hypothetical protein KAU60_03670 [Desulfobacterales bacterium]|nr:hypothetical protein [Desulfobacterales bacterium]